MGKHAVSSSSDDESSTHTLLYSLIGLWRACLQHARSPSADAARPGHARNGSSGSDSGLAAAAAAAGGGGSAGEVRGLRRLPPPPPSTTASAPPTPASCSPLPAAPTMQHRPSSRRWTCS